MAADYQAKELAGLVELETQTQNRGATAPLQKAEYTLPNLKATVALEENMKIMSCKFFRQFNQLLLKLIVELLF